MATHSKRSVTARAGAGSKLRSRTNTVRKAAARGGTASARLRPRKAVAGGRVLVSGQSRRERLAVVEGLAAQADRSLYRVDLSLVAGKFIGETEKNLARVFALAEATDAVLFFDEADALFGKRTEVKDATTVTQTKR